MSVHPLGGDPSSKSKPNGSKSVRTTPVAGSGPLFVTVSVQVTLVTKTVCINGVFVTSKSASGVGGGETVTEALALLLASLGSLVSDVTKASFTKLVTTSTDIAIHLEIDRPGLARSHVTE